MSPENARNCIEMNYGSGTEIQRAVCDLLYEVVSRVDNLECRADALASLLQYAEARSMRVVKQPGETLELDPAYLDHKRACENLRQVIARLYPDPTYDGPQGIRSYMAAVLRSLETLEESGVVKRRIMGIAY